MDEEKKLIAFMGGMPDQEKNSNFIRELEKEGQKQGRAKMRGVWHVPVICN
jgi:predicted transposase YdaD